MSYDDMPIDCIELKELGFPSQSRLVSQSHSLLDHWCFHMYIPYISPLSSLLRAISHQRVMPLRRLRLPPPNPTSLATASQKLYTPQDCESEPGNPTLEILFLVRRSTSLFQDRVVDLALALARCVDFEALCRKQADLCVMDMFWERPA